MRVFRDADCDVPSHHTDRHWGVLWGVLIRTLISFMKVLPSWPSYFPQAQPSQYYIGS